MIRDKSVETNERTQSKAFDYEPKKEVITNCKGYNDKSIADGDDDRYQHHGMRKGKSRHYHSKR